MDSPTLSLPKRPSRPICFGSSTSKHLAYPSATARGLDHHSGGGGGVGGTAAGGGLDVNRGAGGGGGIAAFGGGGGSGGGGPLGMDSPPTSSRWCGRRPPLPPPLPLSTTSLLRSPLRDGDGSFGADGTSYGGDSGGDAKLLGGDAIDDLWMPDNVDSAGV